MELGITQHSIDVVSVLLWCFLAVGGAFVTVLTWLGLVVAKKLEKIGENMSAMNKTMVEIKEDVRKDLAKHDTRLSVLETKMESAVERRKSP
jgi:hypothetical protein